MNSVEERIQRPLNIDRLVVVIVVIILKKKVNDNSKRGGETGRLRKLRTNEAMH